MKVDSLISGRYRIVRELGRGGMGVVYQVQHANTGENLALKVLLAHTGAQADMIERFKREMRAPARIRSEHVVRITDADVAPELDGALFLVMEMLDGFDLEQILRKRGPYSPLEAVWLLTQAARGLDKAHGVGIVHRDLKPENLFLHCREDDTLIVKLLDFGIARLVDRGNLTAAQAKVTQSGAILGTPMYLSPEQAMGDSDKLGPHSDIWSIGLIAYELLTGKTYFEADNVAKLIGQICFAPMPPPSQRAPGLSPGFDRWFERSCDRDPAKRWPSVGVQVAALADALELAPQAAQGGDAPATLKAWFKSQRSEGEPTLLDLKRRSENTAPSAGRTTTSEGRGQSSSAGMPNRKKLALLGGVVIAGIASVGIISAMQRPAARPVPPEQPSIPPTPSVTPPDAGVAKTLPALPAKPAVEPLSRKPTLSAKPGAPEPKTATDPGRTAKKKQPPALGSSPPKKAGGVTGYDPSAP
ncbi:MAG: protein kinase [Polyangia bacterium]